MGTQTRLSQVLKLPVEARDGHLVGRVVDLSVRLHAVPVVHRIAVGKRRDPTHLIPWSLVDRGDGAAQRIRLVEAAGDVERFRIGPAGLGDETLATHELLLGREVLDSQVIDVSGRRLCRVSDVVLERDERGDLTVSAADVGVGALLARMGLARMGRRMPASLVSWSELHLVSTRGHSVQLEVSSDRLRRLDPSRLAEVVARLRTDQATEVLRAVGPTHAAGTLDVSHHQLRRRLLRALKPEEAARVIAAGSRTWRHELERDVGTAGPVGRRFRRTAGWRVHRPSSGP